MVNFSSVKTLDIEEKVEEEEEEQEEKTPEELAKEAKRVRKWLKRINEEKDAHELYRKQASNAWDIYLDDKSGYQVYYPLLWSIVSIEHSATFSGQPNPDIRPRNTTDDPITKQAAQVMQRSLEFYLDNTEFQENMDRVVDDYLVAGLGLPRVKLDTEIIEVEETDEEIIGEQVVRIEHVPWARFGWEPCSNWDHVDWIYFEHHLTEKQIERRWGDIEISMSDEDPSRDMSNRSRTTTDIPKGIIYEIWDRRKEEVIIIAKGCTRILEENEDPLRLKGFFPVPRPMMTNLGPDELIPTTDYSYIQPFDAELNRLYKRRKALTEQIKAASLHDSSLIEIESFMTIQDGDSVPVTDLSARMENADIRKVMMFWPIQERVEALKEVTNQINLIRSHVDDLMGISDILRGSSNPEDGVGTNQIKEKWAGIRLKKKQNAVQEQIRSVFRMMAELTVEHISLENLEGMTQMRINPQTLMLLRDELRRTFSIDIETDSTIAKDEMMDRMARNELLKSTISYVQIVAPAVQSNVIPADLAKEILQVATDPYKKYSRGMDDVIEKLPTTMKQIGDAQKQIQQLNGQNQNQLKELQQKDYALAQYSQAQNARDELETQGKHARDMATATKNLSGASLDDVRAMLTEMQVLVERATAPKVEAETERTRAETQDILKPDLLVQRRGN